MEPFVVCAPCCRLDAGAALSCEEARELIWPHLSGELAEWQADELEEHLDSCAACRTEREGSRTAHRLVREALLGEPPPVPQALLDRFRDDVLASSPALVF